jgi:hypothetical protein
VFVINLKKNHLISFDYLFFDEPCKVFSCRRPEFGKLQISKSPRNTCIAGLVRLKVGILSCHRFRLAFVIRILSNVNVCSVDGSLKCFSIYDNVLLRPKNFVRHFQGLDIKCKLSLSTNNLAFLSLLLF